MCIGVNYLLVAEYFYRSDPLSMVHKRQLESRQSTLHWLLLIYNFKFRSAFRAACAPITDTASVTDNLVALIIVIDVKVLRMN